MSDVDERFRALAGRAERFVFGTGRVAPADGFRRLADAADELGLTEADVYGERGAVERIEAEVSALLGKPAAVLFPSGIMAQQATLRAWCDRSGSRRVALPDLSHLLVHEDDGPRRVSGLELELLTRGREVPTAAALARVPGRLGAVLVELPLRDAGCILPTWEELEELARACGARGVPLHADGARLWESQPFYGRPHAEIAALFDSVYVSLYKGLGGPAGAVVAGPEDLVAELRTWRRRMGGTLIRLTSEAVGGLVGLRDQLPRMASYVERARELAAAFSAAGLSCFPDPPHINTFLVYAARPADEINERLLTFIERTGVLCSPWRATDVPGQSVVEVFVHAVALEHPVDDVVAWFGEVVG